ncbi:MAG TPA: hypothetical protein VHB21_08870 [Minicystis sp.]|nr:hypothetical protein [Minicystis sp.]
MSDLEKARLARVGELARWAIDRLLADRGDMTDEGRAFERHHAARVAGPVQALREAIDELGKVGGR